MPGLDEEKSSQVLQHKPIQKKKSTLEKDKSIPLSEPQEYEQNKIFSTEIVLSKRPAYIEILPEDTLKYIFSFLDIAYLGRAAKVSKRWKIGAATPDLWKRIGLTKYGEYLNQEGLTENPKQKVIQHYLSVLVNTKDDLQEIERLIRNYKLGSYTPSFKKYIKSEFLVGLIVALPDKEEFVAQGCLQAIRQKIEGLSCGGDPYPLGYYSWQDRRRPTYGYKKNPEAARELNDRLIEVGDPEAIKRKIKGLSGDNRHMVNIGDYLDKWVEVIDPDYGYKKDLEALREFNDSLVEKESLEAVERKVEGLAEGKDGYPKDPNAARELNESLVKKGNQEAIKRKIDGFFAGKYGYEKKPQAAREFNESLVAKGDKKAISRKVEGLRWRGNGYKEDLDELREFNESLVAKGDPDAIERKISGLSNGNNGYPKDLNAARELNERLIIEKDDKNAIERKIYGLGVGSNGYAKSPEAARELNDRLVEKGDKDAIERKIVGLSNGVCGYNAQYQALKEFNESLVVKRDPEAITRKIMGLAEGSTCYKKSLQDLKSFLEELTIDPYLFARAIGHYFKAFGLKYGVLGFERDRAKAIKYIKTHNVPY